MKTDAGGAKRPRARCILAFARTRVPDGAEGGMHAAQQAACGLTLSARQTVDVPPVALPSAGDEQMGKAANCPSGGRAVRRVVLGFLCQDLCFYGCPSSPRWTDLEQRQRQQEQQASSSRPRAAVARSCGAPSVSVMRLRADAESSGAFNAVAPKVKKKRKLWVFWQQQRRH